MSILDIYLPLGSPTQERVQKIIIVLWLVDNIVLRTLRSSSCYLVATGFPVDSARGWREVAEKSVPWYLFKQFVGIILGQTPKRLRHRGVPYVPTGHMCDIPCLWRGQCIPLCIVSFIECYKFCASTHGLVLEQGFVEDQDPNASCSYLNWTMVCLSYA